MKTSLTSKVLLASHHHGLEVCPQDRLGGRSALQGAVLGKQAQSAGEHKRINKHPHPERVRLSSPGRGVWEKLGAGTHSVVGTGTVSRARKTCSLHLTCGHATARGSVSALEGCLVGAEPSTQTKYNSLLLLTRGPELVPWPHPHHQGGQVQF